MAANKQNKKQNQQTHKISQVPSTIQHPTNKKSKIKVSKKATSVQKSSCFSSPWLFGILILIGSIAGAITYDVYKNGNGVFKQSSTGLFLKDIGALSYLESGTLNTLYYSARGFQWLEVNVPVYYDKTLKVLMPYALFSRDLAKISWNNSQIVFANLSEIIGAKYKVLYKYVEQHVPGLSEKVETAIEISWRFVNSTSKLVYHSSVNFFKTNVFIGHLSPENLGKALNQTQQWAGEYYSWFHRKVDLYAKIKSS